MSHLAAESAYKKLEERLNKFPQGAPPSETLYKILSILFNEKEARQDWEEFLYRRKFYPRTTWFPSWIMKRQVIL